MVSAVLFLTHTAAAGMLTFYATGINSADNSGLIVDDLLATPQMPGVGLPANTNSQAGYDSFIAALNGADFGIEDFEFRNRSSFVGVGPQSVPSNISLNLDFQRLPPGSGSLPISASLTANPAILSDITLANPGPVDNAAGRFPVQIPIGGTQYLDTNTVNLDFLIDFDQTPVNALGFFGTDFGDFNGQVMVAVTDSNGMTTQFNMPHPFVPISSPTNELNASLLFFGFTSDMPISQVRLIGVDASNATSLEDRFGFDNLVVSAGPETPTVPEPSSIILLLAGLTAAAVFFRKKLLSPQVTA